MNFNPSTPITTDERIIEAARRLGRAIGESKVYLNFEESRRLLLRDQMAQQLLRQFQQTQQQVQMMQSWGGAERDDIQRLQDMREKMIENQTLKTFFLAQDDLVTQLRELNRFMADNLGFDFAEMTKPAGGCC
jgi:cell fate (sporulation/competence/biofilm development) regulator YlbF (YheA/YmcA/DUF963 family)